MGKCQVFSVSIFILFIISLPSFAEEYSQNQNSDWQNYNQNNVQQYQSNNNDFAGQSQGQSVPIVNHSSGQGHRNHPPRTGASYPTESRTGIVVPLFFPMIVFVGVVLLVFFAVVGSAAVIGSATGGIGRHDGPPPHFHQHFPLARELTSSAALAKDVLSSEECVERVSCEVFHLARGHKAEKWLLRVLEILPTAQSNLTKRASRTIWRQSKSSRNSRSGKSRATVNSRGCQEFQCTRVMSFVDAVKKLKA